MFLNVFPSKNDENFPFSLLLFRSCENFEFPAEIKAEMSKRASKKAISIAEILITVWVRVEKDRN